MIQIHTIIRPLLITLGILLIPFFGNIFVDGWNWSWGDFVMFGTILLSYGLAYEFVGKDFKTGVFSGFLFGQAVAACTIAMMRYFNPDEDIAGIAILTFLIFGLFFSFIGYLIQRNIWNRKK